MVALLLLATASVAATTSAATAAGGGGFVSIRSTSTGECIDTTGRPDLLVDLYACVSDGHNERFAIDAANSTMGRRVISTPLSIFYMETL